MSEKLNDINDLASICGVRRSAPLKGAAVLTTQRAIRPLPPVSPASPGADASLPPVTDPIAPIRLNLSELDRVAASRSAEIVLPSHLDPMAIYLASRVSQRTAETAAEALERIARLFETEARLLRWETLRYAHADAIRTALMRKYPGGGTANLTLAHLKGVLKQCWQLGLMSHEDFARTTAWRPLPEDRSGTGYEIPEANVEALVRYIHRVGPNGREFPASAYGACLGAMFALLLGVGFRASEAGGITLAGLDLESRKVTFQRKGGKVRTKPIADDEAAILAQWVAVREELEPRSGALLVRVDFDGRLGSPLEFDRDAIKYRCAVAARHAGIRHFRPHDCRRTFATRLLREGVDMLTVQRLMDHASPATTAKYDKRQEEEDARARRGVRIMGVRSETEGATDGK